jgi:hypothetical protein
MYNILLETSDIDLENGFGTLFSNYPIPTIIATYPKMDGNKYDNFVYQINMDEYILHVSIVVHEHTKSFDSSLQTFFRSIIESHNNSTKLSNNS